jgi:RNA polymerase sigma-70 factor (ECF subfamily)
MDISVTDQLPGDGHNATQTTGLATLIERVGNGDEKAFSAVYDQLAPVIFGTVKRVLRDHAMSEEVTQEVFVEMWSAVHKFDPDRASVTSWAVTIARRRAVDRVRKEQSQRSRIESLGQQRQDNGADPADEVAETADAQHVRRAVERLPLEQRDVIRLAFLDGQTHGAIAEQLGLPLGTVKGRVRGGIKRLHSDMRYELPPVGPSRWLRGRGGLGWIAVPLPSNGSGVAEGGVSSA